MSRARNTFFTAALCASSLAFGHPLWAQGTFTLVVQEGQSLREIARDYLGDADLWIEILKESGVESVVDVRPGTELVIPVTAVSRANRQLAEALELTQEATQLGARVFTPDLISSALASYEQALEFRTAGNWSSCYSKARESANTAREAVAGVKRLRNMSAAAVLGPNKGSVQGRKGADLDWNRLVERAVLIESERVRTLEDSYADILFRDESRIRLNENSQALIVTMEVDLLTNREKTEVSLIEGDIVALLGGGRAKKEFKLSMPGLAAEADAKSRNFWIGRDDNSAMVANYDALEINVTAHGRSVTLEKNRGVTVDQDTGLGDVVKLLAPARLTGPTYNEVVYQSSVTLQWDPVPGAANYRINVSRDRSFEDVVINSVHITEDASSFDVNVDPGAYFWRVAAIDSIGLPGVSSSVSRFLIMVDDLKPYLLIESPHDEDISRDRTITVRGEVEPGAVLLVDGAPVDVRSDGAFVTTVQLDIETSSIQIQAEDQAGNRTTRRITVRYLPDRTPRFQLDPSLITWGDSVISAPGRFVTIAGFTDQDSFVRLITSEGVAVGISDARLDGRFSFNTEVVGNESWFNLEIVSPSGQITRKRVRVVVDNSNPVILIDSHIPEFTVSDQLAVSGSVSGASSLTFDGEPVELQDDRYTVRIELHSGENLFMLTAMDEGGRLSNREIRITLDDEPPRLLRHDLRLRVENETRVADVEIETSDLSGQQRSVSITVRAGATVIGGRASLSGYRGYVYTGTVVIPNGYTGPVSLHSVELKDYLGNRVLIEF